jgi:hypothetical protein
MPIETVDEHHRTEWSAWPAFNHPPVLTPPMPLIETWRDPTTEEIRQTMFKQKVTLKEKLYVSPDGIEVIEGQAGQEVELNHETAESLVRDGKAEYAGETALKFEDRIKQGQVTANELNPDYGTGPHRDAVALEQEAQSGPQQPAEAEEQSSGSKKKSK